MKKNSVQIPMFDTIEMCEQIRAEDNSPNKELSPEMQRCDTYLREVGTLVRYKGGFWAVEGLPVEMDTGAPLWLWFRSSTIEALSKRGRLVYADERSSHFGKFYTRVYTAQPKTETHV